MPSSSPRTPRLGVALDVLVIATEPDVGALVENIDHMISLEDRPVLLAYDKAFDDEVASLSGYPDS